MKLPHSERGEGPALLLIHPGIADRRIWAEHLEPLAAAGHRAVSVDLQGFGEAAADGEPVAHWEDVVETMDALGIAQASLLGNSFGGGVALRVAALRPQRVSSLLLFAAAAVPQPDPSPQLLATFEAEESAIEAKDFDRALEAILTNWVGPEAPPEARERIATMQSENYRLHAQEPEQAPDPFEADPDLVATIDCPALVAVGEGDMVDFRNAIDELAAKLPRATTNLMPGCGHLPSLEAPEDFRRLVLEFLSQLD